MTDPLRERYDAIPYRHGPIPETHPARLAVIARLLGVPAAPPDRCRVLELGCGEGMNLLPLAERFPHSEFVGVDFSASQIAVGEAARAACGLQNVRFVCADLREFEPESGAFDYVIAHGVYSWVSPEVADRLLSVASAALATDGIAYLSYNTLPGWGLLLGLRAFLLGEMRRCDSPQAQLEHARVVLATLDKSLASQSGAYASLLRECLADMRRKPVELLFHDELSQENHPCTFQDLLAQAARHNLQYLAEAHFATMPIENLPAEVRSEFVALNLDFLGAQQFMDVVYHRSMRNSLLCRGSQSGRRAIDVRVIGDCAAALRMRIVSETVDLSPGVPLRLESSEGMVLEIAQPAEKAMAVVLAHAAPERVPFGKASRAASDLLARANLPSEMSDPSAQAALLYRLFSLDAVDLVLMGHGDWLRTAEPAAPSPLMRYQAAADFLVANRWHEPIRIAGDERERLVDVGCVGNLEARRHAGLLA